jgi:purine-binding chemotaxis protein CheW
MDALPQVSPLSPMSARPESDPAGQFVTFTCAGRALAIDIMAVREIRSWAPTTPLPGQPSGAVGVLDIRGNIIEVYDLALLLGATQQSEGAQIVLVVSLAHRDVGLAADAVSDIVFAGADELRPVPRERHGSNAGLVANLIRQGDKIVAVLDLDALFPDFPSQFVAID